MQTLQSHSFPMLKIGDRCEWERTIRIGDIRAWRTAFSDIVDDGEDRAVERAAGVGAAVGILSSSFAALVCSRLPGPGSRIQRLALEPVAALPLDRPVRLSLTVRECRAADHVVLFDALAVDPEGKPLVSGEIAVTPPATPVAATLAAHRLEGLLEQAKALPPMKTGVVHPLSVDALSGAIEAMQAGLIEPLLYGPEAALRELARSHDLDLAGCTLIDTADEADSAARAARDAGAGKVQALMKGSLHTDILLHAAMQAEAGLRTGRILSHIALISAPTYGRRFVVTDAALNIAPTLEQKRGITQNAIGFMRALQVEQPKVAVIAAVEMVHDKMPSTLEAAALAKMADRGQIVGGLVDGPLDLDAAVDADAAATKHIVSPVAGQADILLMPNIEAGNAVYKTLGFTADAQTAGLVVGARVPIILTSRADTAAIRRFSAAAAVLYADALARRPDDIVPPLVD